MIVELWAAGHTEDEVVRILVANGEREDEAKVIVALELGRIDVDKAVVDEGHRDVST